MARSTLVRSGQHFRGRPLLVGRRGDGAGDGRVRRWWRRASLQFRVSVPAAVRSEPVTGRAYVLITTDSAREPRLAADDFTTSIPLFGTDVAARAGQAAVITDTTLGYPVASLRDIPAGDYYVQAIVAVYTQFHRSDGHTIWAHMDQWEGQHFGVSPGTLVSTVQRVHLDPRRATTIPIAVSRALPPIALPADSKWVKHIKIQSDLLTKFWGQPMYLGRDRPAAGGIRHASRTCDIRDLRAGTFQPAGPRWASTPCRRRSPSRSTSCSTSYNLKPGYRSLPCVERTRRSRA